MKLNRLLLLFLFALVFSSCGELENIEFGNPEQVKVQGFEDNNLNVSLKIPVNNPSIYPIKITDIDLRVYLDGKYIGKLIVDENIKINSKSSKLYDLPVKVRLSNILGAAFLMMNLKQGQKVEVKFTGTVTGKSLLIKKTIDVDETTQIVL